MTESKRLSPDSKNIETPLEALATRRDEGVAARECAALSSADRDLEMDGRTIGRSGSLIPSSSVVETRVRDLAGPSTSVCGYYDLRSCTYSLPALKDFPRRGTGREGASARPVGGAPVLNPVHDYRLSTIVDAVNDPIVAAAGRVQAREIAYERLTQLPRAFTDGAPQGFKRSVSNLFRQVVQMPETFRGDPDLIHLA